MHYMHYMHTYTNDTFDHDFNAQIGPDFSRALTYAARGGSAEFVMPVLHRQIGADDLSLCGAQRIGFRPDRAEAYPGSRLFDAFGIVASDFTAVRQKILAGEEVTTGDMREMFDSARARAGAHAPRMLVTHSAASALAIHHATGEPALVAMTPDNMLRAADYAALLAGSGEAVVLVPDSFGTSKRAARVAAEQVGCRVADMTGGGRHATLMHGLIAAQHQADTRSLDAHALRDFIRDRIFAPLDAAQPVSQSVEIPCAAPMHVHGAALQRAGIER